MSSVPIFLDCDPGIDDAVALTVLLRAPRAHIVGIGTVAGNTGALQGAHNAAALLKLSDHPFAIPIGVGAVDPINGAFGGGFPHVHGESGLAEEDLDPGDDDFVDAVDLLIELAHAHRGSLRIVAIGPLTNLALALEKEPTLPQLVSGVFIMGGAWAVPGNVSPFAEANIWSDATAAHQVLTSGMKITLFPLDVTMEHLFTQQDITHLSDHPNSLTSALGRMLQFYGEKYQATLGKVLTPLHDPLTAAAAVGLVTVTKRVSTTVAVDTDETHRGRLRTGDGRTPPVNIVLAIDPAAAGQIHDLITGGEDD